jgi:PAS domain S-box-containing protein
MAGIGKTPVVRAGDAALRADDAALRATEDRFRALVTATSGVVYSMSPDWSEMRHLVGKGFIADTDSPSGAWLQKYIPPDEQPRLLAAIGEAIRTSSVFKLEHRVLRVDGTVGWTFSRAIPIKNANGETLEWFGAASNVTDRKQAEEALRSSQARLQGIIGSAMDAVISVDEQQRIVVFNKAAEAVFQCPASEALASTLDRFIPKASRAAHSRHIQRFGTQGDTARSMTSPAILSAVRSNGEEFPIEATISHVYADGKHLYTVILRDITARKLAELALIRSEKLASVGRMAASIAHEINNPLGAVTNLLYLARSEPDLPESVRKYLEMADDELKRIAHLTRQSLGFYRESRAPERTSVHAVVQSAIDLLSSKIKSKQAVIETQWDGNVEIIAIAGELRQVFSNLLANSLDAIDDQGIIKLRVSTCAALGAALKSIHRCVRITIADNGKGISATIRRQIFEPFVTTKGSTGTGLGLWVSKQIIDKHDGTIQVRSNSGGAHSGTVFSITLPVAATADGHSAGA